MKERVIMGWLFPIYILKDPYLSSKQPKEYWNVRQLKPNAGLKTPWGSKTMAVNFSTMNSRAIEPMVGVWIVQNTG